MADTLTASGVSPNAISVIGMLFALAAGCLLAATTWEPIGRIGFLLAIPCIVARLLANMLDGMVAERRQQLNPLGPLYNEVPDRISDAAVLIGAGYAAGSHIVWGYVAACVALFVAYVRTQGRACGAPSEYCGPLAKQQRMWVIVLAAAYAGLAPIAWQPLVVGLGGALALALVIVGVGGFLTALRRLVRVARSLRCGL
jgi:phosphatidylglycerophosphate synthase